jgi:hypothetical protein
MAATALLGVPLLAQLSPNPTTQPTYVPQPGTPGTHVCDPQNAGGYVISLSRPCPGETGATTTTIVAPHYCLGYAGPMPTPCPPPPADVCGLQQAPPLECAGPPPAPPATTVPSPVITAINGPVSPGPAPAPAIPIPLGPPITDGAPSNSPPPTNPGYGPPKDLLTLPATE